LSEQALDNENLDPAKLRKYLKNINHSSRYIHALLENILSWIRLQTDSLQPRSEYISIEELVRENLQLFDLVVRQKELDIVVDMPGSLCIYADREMTESIFRNLLSNAIKFSYRGKKILISAFLDADLHEVELSVRDYGVGMNERQIQNFRDARLWNSTSGTEKEKGTGLGLIISKEFAIANEGSIELDSNKNRGTEVKLRMPANVKKEMTEECLT
jgi:signal transduction histidine kinase